MAVFDVWKVTVIGNVAGKVFNNVMHYQTTSSFGPVESESDGLIDAFTEAYLYKQLTNDYLDFLTVSGEITEIQVRNLTQPLVGQDWLVPTGDGDGKLIGDNLSKQLALLTRKKTGQIGKSFSGRNYWVAGNEFTTSGNTIDGAFLADFMDWYTTTTTIINITLQFSFILGVYSPTLAVFTPVTTVSGFNKTRTQRGRAG